MAATGFALFDTAIGRCGIAWSERGIAGVQLPEASVAETRARLQRRFPEAREQPDASGVRAAIDAIVALLGGEARDLGELELDLANVPAFHRRVYEVTRTIPPGTTLSYGEIARRLDEPGSARAVGQALGKNPFAIVVPCHRVLAAGGKPGGFSATGGAATKLRMLAIEGARIAAAEPTLFDGARSLGFDAEAALAHVRSADPNLARVIDAVGPFRMERKETLSVFGALAEAIVHQQLNGKAAATIYGRLCGLFPRAGSGPTPRHILGASDADLRGAGLSRAKLLALRDLAERAKSRALPSLGDVETLNDEEIIERLTEVRGVGRWTAEMFLMFRLGRPDVLPVGDFGIRKGFQIAFRTRAMPSPEAVEKRGERWRPYRTLASWYLWRATELPRSPRRA
ncbi:MAG: methylated-DNA--[protein]-cysteine S-methyltransferase [Myxococcota bacterium]